jgi:hypothetical protein
MLDVVVTVAVAYVVLIAVHVWTDRSDRRGSSAR